MNGLFLLLLLAHNSKSKGQHNYAMHKIQKLHNYRQLRRDSEKLVFESRNTAGISRQVCVYNLNKMKGSLVIVRCQVVTKFYDGWFSSSIYLLNKKFLYSVLTFGSESCFIEYDISFHSFAPINLNDFCERL